MIQKIFEKCKMLRTQAMDISQILAITWEFYPLTLTGKSYNKIVYRRWVAKLPTDVVLSRYQENLPLTHLSPGKSSLKTQHPTHHYSMDLVL